MCYALCKVVSYQPTDICNLILNKISFCYLNGRLRKLSFKVIIYILDLSSAIGAIFLFISCLETKKKLYIFMCKLWSLGTFTHCTFFRLRYLSYRSPWSFISFFMNTTCWWYIKLPSSHPYKINEKSLIYMIEDISSFKPPGKNKNTLVLFYRQNNNTKRS